MNTSRGYLIVAMLIAAGAVAVSGPCLDSASASRSCEYFRFNKDDNITSTLKYKSMSGGDCVNVLDVRAGSGTSQDSCVRNAGWLPNGWYDLQNMYDDYAGSDIRGRVWQLSDKYCWDGTKRDELFIHSEETPDNSQICTSNSDDPWCWDSTPAYSGASSGTNDYHSLACIKVRRASPEGSWNSDLSDTHTVWHAQTNLPHGVFRQDTVYVDGG